MDFQKSDLTFSSTSPAIPYRRRKCEDKSRNKWGQFKLLMTEVEFFNLFWNPQQVPNPVIVYAGAASGIHIPYLSQLFPTFEFHLYDPAKFDIQPSEIIHIYNEPFTNKIAKKWSGRQDIFFISDIRTVGWENPNITEDEVEEGVWKDMCLQQEWYDIIKPVKAHMKFRLPYILEKTTVTNVEYLYGHIFIQPWTGPTSTETRIVPEGHKRISWDSLRYEQQCFFHNTIVRPSYKYKNPFTNRLNPIYSDQLLNDYDSRLTTQIILDYLSRFTEEGTIYTAFKRWIDDAIQALDWNGSGKTLASIRNESIHVYVPDTPLLQRDYTLFVKSNQIVDILKHKSIPHWDIMYDLLVYPERHIETLQHYIIQYPNLPFEEIMTILQRQLISEKDKSNGMILTDGKSDATIQYRNNRTQVPIYFICEMKDKNIPKDSQLAIYYRYFAFMSDFWKTTIPPAVKQLLDDAGVATEFSISPFSQTYPNASGFYPDDKRFGLEYNPSPKLVAGNYLFHIHNSVYLKEQIENILSQLKTTPNIVLYILGPQNLNFDEYEKMKLSLQPAKYTLFNAYRQQDVRPHIPMSFYIVSNTERTVSDQERQMYSQAFYI